MFLLLVTIYSCSFSCDSDKDDIKSKHGTPEEVNSYSSSGYTSDTWWYWSKGISFTFTYTSSKGCEVSTYTFTPITDKSLQSKYNVDKKLINTKISNDCINCP